MIIEYRFSAAESAALRNLGYTIDHVTRMNAIEEVATLVVGSICNYYKAEVYAISGAYYEGETRWFSCKFEDLSEAGTPADHHIEGWKHVNPIEECKKAEAEAIARRERWERVRRRSGRLG